MKSVQKKLVVASLIAAVSSASLPVMAHAQETTPSQGMGNMQNMQGMDGKKGMGMGGMQGMDMDNMPMMKMMKERQAMMEQHMNKMETSLGNIEALLKELVALQKSRPNSLPKQARSPGGTPHADDSPTG